MARDKGFEQRMQGMVYACRLAQEQGVDALVKTVKQRGVTKVDITASDKQLNDMWGALSDNIGQNMLTTAVWVLHDAFGFGQKRLQQFITEFDKATANLMRLDYMGEHYVTLEDYAVELNQKYDLGLDVIKATLATDMADKQDARFGNVDKVTGIINALRLAGHEDAAAYLESKKEV